MNDFEEDYSIPSCSALTRARKSAMGEDDIVELVWQNGEVVTQRQAAQRGLKKSGVPDGAGERLSGREQPENHHQHQQVLLEEDEMASWLHYPLHETNDFCAELLYPSASAGAAPFYSSNPIQSAPAVARPPITRVDNFSKHNSRGKEATVVDSSDTPAGSRISEAAIGRCLLGNCSSDINNACEITVTPSSTATAEHLDPPLDSRKRKGRDEEVECQSEDAELESAEGKKSGGGSTSTKRSRAAEVHNLSERRRRDRINEKMRALQELIPRCNKSDKASMLDEAIEYLKSLQMQVHDISVLISDGTASNAFQLEMMMSMGCSMVPMMFPGIQQFMPPMGMGMGMGMGMNRPMMPFPNVFAGPSVPSPAAAAHLGPRFPMPAYQIPPVPSPDSSRIQASSQTDPKLTARPPHDPNRARGPNFADPYQQHMSLHPVQIPMPQSRAMAPPNSSRPRSGEGPDNIDNNHPGT